MIASRSSACLLLGLLSMAGPSLGPAPAIAQARPNIVLIVADDLGPGDLGAYGQERILTPHLDALAREGLVFRHAYSAAPVCAPSRCALLTGLYAEHCSVTENARPNVPLSFDDVNLGLLFQAVGYRTAMIGKWGLGGELRDGSDFTVFSRPQRVGFDVFAGLLDQETAEQAFFSALWHGDERRVLAENTNGAEGVWGAPLLIEEALSFLDAVPSEQPFFLYFAPTLPHREYRVPLVAAAYATRDWPEPERVYATMISELDDEVGRLVAALAERGLTERTLVVFTSDNGPNGIDGHTVAFFDSASGLRGQKRDLYEGGLHVPLIVSGPGISAGEREAPVALYDLLPTFAEVAAVSTYSAVDGRSFAALLRGDGPLTREGLLFSSDEARGGDEAKAAYAVRAGDLSLVELRSGTSELFDLAADPTQSTDLASARPDDVARLRALRERLSAPRSPAPPPALIVEGVGVPPSAEAVTTPVFSFDFEREGDPLESRVARPRLRLLPIGGAALHEGALVLPRGASGDASAHAVLGAQPSFGFGRSDFTFSTRVRLSEAGLTRAAVACARPAGRELRYTDWAVLARTGEVPTEDLSSLTPDARAARARRVGVLFGDPTLSNRGLEVVERQPTLPVVSSLSIDDDAWHTLTVVYDAAGASVRFTLDGAEDVVAVPSRAHYPSDGPLVMGACLDEDGHPSWPLVGALDDVVLARGAGPIDLEATLDGALDLGRFEAGETAHTAHLTLRNPLDAEGRGRALRVEVDARGIDDPRLSVGPAEVVLLPGASTEIDIEFALRPGPLSDPSITLVATDALLGTLARGTPLRIAIRGEVQAPPSRVGLIEGGLLAAVLLGALALSRRALRR